VSFRVQEAMAKPPPSFASLEGLFDHGRRDGFDFRPTLLRVLTDFYLQKPTHPLEDERYYTELALRLINSTDLPVRTAVAERLAGYPAAPHQVIMRLARDVVDVAEPILRHSTCLTTADLELISSDCGPAHAAIIAARSPAGPQGNGTSARRRGYDPESAELNELFFAAGAAERRLILLNLEYAAPAPIELTAAAAGEIVSRLEAAAMAHRIEAFTRELEDTFAISGRLARRIVADERGEPIVAAVKALRAPRAVLERILLFVNPAIGRSVARVHELATRYDEISAEAAERLVAIWQAAEPRGHVQPVAFPLRRAAGRDGVAAPSIARQPTQRSERGSRGTGSR
jgi:hypothetical protein